MSAPLYDVTTPNTNPGLSASIWRNKLQDYVSGNPVYGAAFTDRCTRRSVVAVTTAVGYDGLWAVQDAEQAGGNVTWNTGNDGVNGIGVLANDGTTNHYGAEIFGPQCFKTGSATTSPQGDCLFEVDVDLDTADTVFVGLTEAETNFLGATSALPADQDYCGFYTDDAGTTLTFYCNTDNAGGTAAQDSFVIPTADYDVTDFIKLAARINQDGSVECAVNGKWYSPATNGIASTSVPIEALSPTISCTAGGGTTAPSVTVRNADFFCAASTD